MRRHLTYGLVCVLILSGAGYAKSLDLSGPWAFALDPDGVGAGEAWYAKALPQSIRLPGSLQEQGYGDKPSAQTQWTSGIGMALLKDPRFAEYVQSDDFKCPFWLTPDRHYVGRAWYQRQVTVPTTWKGQRVVLHLERPHWKTTVWVNDRPAGSRDSLGTPHDYDLTDVLAPGRAATLTICVDNSYVVPVGRDAHSISDQTQSNWNGIAGAIELRGSAPVWFDDVQVFPDVDKRQAKVIVTLGARPGQSGSGTLTVQAVNDRHVTQPQAVPVTWGEQGGQVSFTHAMGADCLLWDEYSPALYRLQLHLQGDGVTADKTVTFGMRDLTIRGTQFAVNGRTIFLRGTLECCIFPQHGYPPTDPAEWKRIIRIAKAHGLNHFRFHSWCPPEAAFIAADEEGFYLQVEGSCWAGFGDGTALDKWIYDEIDRMIRAYGNHPSWFFFSPSNEPSGRNCDQFLGAYLTALKAKDSRRFYVAGAGWPQIEENQYSIEQAVRLQRWPTLKFDQPPQTFDDYRSHIESRPVPVVGHEIGQWCAYPDVDEVSQYTGVLKARNMDIFRDKLQKAGMDAQAREFLMASGKFQTLLYKQEIEAALRTPGFGGFALLDLHDFPGQGTAPVGALNALWQSKGYVTAEQYRRFCNDVVPLARMKKRVFASDETLDVIVDVANYGPRDLGDNTVQWVLHKASGRSAATGRLEVKTIATGGLTRIGEIHVPLGAFTRAARLNLELRLQGTDYVNDWNVWVYPAQLPAPASDTVLETDDPAQALKRLEQGGRVLLSVNARQVRGNTVPSFQPIFWNRITFPRNRIHTLGILCDPDHPAFADFPTDFHSNWQWQDLLGGAKPLILDGLPAELTPVVQTIDDWNDCRRLGVLLEAKVEAGRLVMTSMDLRTNLGRRPVARQLRHSLLTYMSSTSFDPAVTLSADQVRRLIVE